VCAPKPGTLILDFSRKPTDRDDRLRVSEHGELVLPVDLRKKEKRRAP
jgi:hypothetical protein